MASRAPCTVSRSPWHLPDDCCGYQGADTLDDGNIDLISIDTEGSEWYVIKYLKSRPDVISIETHGAVYVNPKIDEIESWMAANGYVVYFKDKSDSVYVRPDKIRVSILDQLALAWKNVRIRFRRFRKQLFRKG